MDTPAIRTSAADGTCWHGLSVEETLRKLDTSTDKGLDAGEAQARLQRFGPNRLPTGKKSGPLKRFLSQLNNILIYILLGAGFVKLMLGLWVDAGVIFGVVLLNTLIGFIQEGKAEKALDSIRNMLSAEARTLRGGEPRLIPAEDLVPGDVVLLESGDKVPADLRLTEAKNLRTRRLRSRANRCRRTSRPRPYLNRPRWGTARAWRSPAQWSCLAAPRGSWSRRAAKPSSAASTRCSRA